MHDTIREVSIDYNYYDSDHLLLTVSLDYPCLPVSIPESGAEIRIEWTFSEEDRVDRLYRLVYLGMRESFLSHHMCDRQYCADASYKLGLDYIWQNLLKLFIRLRKLFSALLAIFRTMCQAGTLM